MNNHYKAAKYRKAHKNRATKMPASWLTKQGNYNLPLSLSANLPGHLTSKEVYIYCLLYSQEAIIYFRLANWVLPAGCLA